MKEYDVVRVVRIERPDRLFDGTKGVSRPPKVGDTGTIVHVLEPDRELFVECVDGDGMTVWLAQFGASELEEVGAI